jgi:hypothetical protein
MDKNKIIIINQIMRMDNIILKQIKNNKIYINIKIKMLQIKIIKIYNRIIMK